MDGHVWESEAWLHPSASRPPVRGLAKHHSAPAQGDNPLGNQDESILLLWSSLALLSPFALLWSLMFLSFA